MLSYAENIPAVLRAVKESKAETILDVGPAFGKYGLLIREQELSNKAAAGDMEPKSDLRIEAIEYTRYFTTGENGIRLKKIYDFVHETDVFSFELADFYSHELVLFIDVIEHYDKEKIKTLFAEIPGKILISTPKRVHMYTEHFYGDPHHHVSQWQDSDFSGWHDYSTDLSHIFLRDPK